MQTLAKALKAYYNLILYCNYYIVNHSWVSRSTSRANRGPYQALSCSHVLVTCSHVYMCLMLLAHESNHQL